MRGKRFKILFILLMLGIPLFVLVPRTQPDGMTVPNPQSIYDSTFSVNLETYTAENFPWITGWRQFRLDIKLAGGQKEHNGIFLTSEGLMKQVDSPVPAMLVANMNTVADFADYCHNLDRPVFLAVIPSASGVQRQNLPAFHSAVDEQQIIDDIYSELFGKVTTVGAHIVLSDHRDQYIYYRTEDNLTAYGGYLIYQEMVSRLLGLDPTETGSYHVTYETNGYYGDLYHAAPYRDVQPDTLTTYHFSDQEREYLVTHTQMSGRKVYHTLYPTQSLALGNMMDLYLGGQSAVVDIRTNFSNNRRLLVFGDKTALSYLPFLTNHYRQITLVDLFYSESLYASIRLEDYSQILFAYGFESFTSTSNPSHVRTLMQDEP